MKKIYEQINKDNWTQNGMAVNIHGDDIGSARDEHAVKWCAFGWLMKVYPEVKLCAALKKIYQHVNKDEGGIVSWNDTEGRTVKEVKALFKKVNL